MTRIDTSSAHRLVLAVCIVVQVMLGVVAARAYLARHRTLAADGDWVASKTTLERGLLGAFSFVTETQARVTILRGSRRSETQVDAALRGRGELEPDDDFQAGLPGHDRDPFTEELGAVA